jgi:hypothetical protein
MTTEAAPTHHIRRRVRVWFGSHVIADYIAEPELAARYEQAMRKRFAGLKVTSDPLPLPPPVTAALPDAARPLPSESLWELTP